MLDARLLDRLSGTLSRLRRLRLHRGLATGWIVGALVAGGLLLLDVGPSMLVLALGAATALACGWWRSRPAEADLREAARRVEAHYPDLDSRLLAALEQQPQLPGGVYGYLQMVVLGDVLQHARRREWRQAVPPAELWRARLQHLAALVLFGVVVTSVLRHRTEVLAVLGVETNPAATAAAPAAGLSVAVKPGDVEIERGTGLLITAQFTGDLPSRVNVVTRDAAGAEARLPMAKSLDDPLFGVRLAEVAADLTYRVEFDGRASDEFTVTTFEYPRLEQADARIRYPSYTGLADEERPDIRRVSIVEGSELTLALHLNKPVVQAVLEPRDGGEAVPLTSPPDAPRRLTTVLSPRESRTYRLHLTDQAGRREKETVELAIDVLPNRPPELKFAFPARDVRVSPLEEVTLEGTAWDDFGLREQGLVLQFPDGREEQHILGKDAAARTIVSMTHQVPLEPLGVQPDDLVSFYFYAEDVGPDGQPRRTFSDMFFAEVRPFEETYRQAPNQSTAGQQQQPGQGEGGPSQQLLQLQRQIVTAAWNLIRRERTDPPSEKFPEDVQTLVESQQQARELAEEYAGGVEDVILRQHAQEALRHMTGAWERFQSAADGPTVAPLNDARAEARQAYQALLKLQAREHAVQNSQSPSGGRQGQNQRMNAQLRALELKNDRHRYETEQQARRQQEAAQQQALETLNRLRELARRQEDLNERIRQVENALREARSEAERQELQRQLRRLQEEQQEILRDVDDLREQMNRQENRPQTADAREALDQVRERVYQSAQALQQQQTSRALVEGTRAERELNELKEQFRQRTAGRFADEVRELRDDVRQLAQEQADISQTLGGDPRGPQGTNDSPRQRPSLRDPEQTDRQALAERLARQQQELAQILQRMRELVEASETSEPLLSKRLYDALRASRADRPEEALSAAAELLRRGLEDPARQAEAQARAGIDKLREGVDRAAESVLGDETEALRRAREQLALLTEAIGRELAAHDPNAQRDRRQTGGTEGNRSPEQPEGSPQSPQRGSDPSGQDRPSEQNRQSHSTSEPSRANAAAPTGEQPDRGNPSTDRTPPPSGAAPAEASGADRPPEQRPAETASESTGAESPRNDPSGERSTPPSGEPSGRPPSSRTPQSRPSAAESPGSQPTGSQPSGSQPSGSQPSGSQPSPGEASSTSQSPSATAGGQGGNPNLDARRRMLSSFAPETFGGGNEGPVNPLTGEQFLQWSDRMRDVEEMIGDPRLRAELATVRERARALRIEFKRHSKQPNWELVRTSIYGPMRELEQRLAEELARRTPVDRLVPIDRDAVPEQYADLVRRYYEQLSRQP